MSLHATTIDMIPGVQMASAEAFIAFRGHSQV